MWQVFAKEVLDSLGSERYQERAATYWRLRFSTCESDSATDLVTTLAELATDLASTAADSGSSMLVGRLVEEKANAKGFLDPCPSRLSLHTNC